MLNLNRARLILNLTLLAVFSTSACYADTTLAEFNDACSWFDSLGYPDIGKLPFVDLSWSYSVTGAKGIHDEHEHRFGFLIEDKGTSFRVFLPDLTEETFVDTNTGPIPRQHLKCVHVDMAKWMQRRMTLPIKSDYRAATDGIGGNLDHEAQMFVLARPISARLGEQPAVNLFNHEVAVYGWPPSQGTPSLRNRLATSISLANLRKAIGLFQNVLVTRASILSDMQSIIRRFSDTKWVATAQDYVSTLSPMVTEDDAQAARASTLVKPLTGEDLVRNLIFRLRDQPGHQYVNPDIVHFLDYGDIVHDTTPAAQLAKLGVKAVPLLIEALDDRRFTRGVEYRTTSTEELGCGVTSVRDAALQILDRISGRTFEAIGNMVVDAHGAYVKAAAQSWWSDYQKLGELALLLSGASRGDGESSEQAEILVKRYPDVALPAISAGLKRATDTTVAYCLVQAACKLKDKAVTGLLYDQMMRGSALSVRTEAAWELNERHDSRALPAMLAEWKRPWPNRRGDFLDANIAQFLLNSAKPAAVAVLRQYLRAKPVEVRLETILSILGGGWRYTHRGKDYVLRSAVDPTAETRLDRAVEKVLASELLDTDTREGFGMGGEHPLENPRVCDAASMALSVRWPSKYRCKDGGSLFERDTQRIRAYNAWMKSAGKSAVPLPSRTIISPASAQTMAGALTRFTLARTNAERKIALDAVEKIGLPALPAVRKVLDYAKPGRPGVADLKELAGHLACIVRAVDTNDALASLSPDTVRRLHQIKGKPLTASFCINLLSQVADKLRDGLTEAVLYAYRDNDGAGFHATMKVLPGKLDKPGAYTSWTYKKHVLVGDSTYLLCTDGEGGNSNIHGPRSVVTDTYDDDGLAGAIGKALAYPPLETILIDVRLTRTQ